MLDFQKYFYYFTMSIGIPIWYFFFNLQIRWITVNDFPIINQSCIPVIYLIGHVVLSFHIVGFDLLKFCLAFVHRNIGPSFSLLVISVSLWYPGNTDLLKWVRRIPFSIIFWNSLHRIDICFSLNVSNKVIWIWSFLWGKISQ